MHCSTRRSIGTLLVRMRSILCIALAAQVQNALAIDSVNWWGWGGGCDGIHGISSIFHDGSWDSYNGPDADDKGVFDTTYNPLETNYYPTYLHFGDRWLRVWDPCNDVYIPGGQAVNIEPEVLHGSWTFDSIPLTSQGEHQGITD